MLRRFGAIAILLTTLLPAQALADRPEDPALAAYREKILYQRVWQVLWVRAAAIRDCGARSRDLKTLMLAAELESALQGADPESPELLMAAYQRSFPFESKCASEIREKETSLAYAERKSFPGIGAIAVNGCELQTGWQAADRLVQVVSDLDPHCVLGVQEDFTGPLDTNPCYAGVRVILDGVRNEPDFIGDLRGLVHEMLRDFNDSRKSLDLWSAYARMKGHSLPWMLTPAAEREHFLALVAYLYLATRSELGYVEPLSDANWLVPLKSGKTPDEALVEYNEAKKLKDLHSDLLVIAKKKGLKVTMAGLDVSEANRHDFMSALLSCHYRREGEPTLAMGLTRAVGVAYETKDAVSHYFEGSSWETIARSFARDVGRYHGGASWGYEFCGPGIR